jgi:putative ABC transport system substrate-binding protein
MASICSPEMPRRAFMAVIAGGLLAAPLVPEAQQAGKVYRIGYLAVTSAAGGLPNLEALRVGLITFGYLEGKNVIIEARWADGSVEHLPRLAAELTNLRVDLLCTAGGQASAAAKQATPTIPIVFANVAFPIQSGLVESYPRPGANITGIAFTGAEYGKRLELLKEAYPKLDRVALIYNSNNPGSMLALQETQRWATALGVRLEPHRFRGPQGFDHVYGAIAGKRPNALMTTADSLLISFRTRIVDFAATLRLPSIYPTREFVVDRGLLFYGASIPEMFRDVAAYVDKILKGAKPVDLPVEQPRKFDLVINRKTAKALGLTIPQSLLQRADQVIE